MYEGSDLSKFSPLVNICHPNCNHTSRSELLSCYGFCLHLYNICISSLEKVLFEYFAHFFIWVVFLLLSYILYIFWMLIMWVILSTNNFSYSIGCLFILFIYYLNKQNLFICLKINKYLFFEARKFLSWWRLFQLFLIWLFML